MEIYKKYRPKSLKRVIGNESTVLSLRNMLQRGTVPHTVLFHGPSGCGKTTLARILKENLDCGDFDFRELNCSDTRGIDTIREISRTMNISPVSGSCKIWLLDEVHQLSRDAQNAALKILEDTPDHVYFFLCTTDPQKIIKTIRNRCCEMPVVPLSRKQIIFLLTRIVKREKVKIDPELFEDIADVVDGSSRKALVLLEKVIQTPEDKREQAIQSLNMDESKEIYDLCIALLRRDSWSTVANMISQLKEDPETIRYAVLGIMRSILLKKPSDLAALIIEEFSENFYDSKMAGVVLACYNVLHR